ncbi:hypothetical protein KSD_56040 [Ktedonobacter sp. SOSP1-85]|nr:hypothetical protein KSD_56040 [Ktedonobacter sp. SOSP1-85]
MPLEIAAGIGYTIARSCDETRTWPFNRALYKERNVVERTINRLKQFRRVATRYEKRAVNFLAMVTLACILLWLFMVCKQALVHLTERDFIGSFDAFAFPHTPFSGTNVLRL